MQKLVKKTRHYQTLVPVEAYQGEEGYFLQEEISIALGVGALGVEAAVMAGFVSSPVGHAVAIDLGVASLANTNTGREVIAAVNETVAEYQQREFEAYQMAGEAALDALSDANDAFGDAVIDWVRGMDPGVEDPYGEHGTYYANE